MSEIVVRHVCHAAWRDDRCALYGATEIAGGAALAPPAAELNTPRLNLLAYADLTHHTACRPAQS